jgi:hypothetical protein
MDFSVAGLRKINNSFQFLFILFCFVETESCYIAQAGFELMTFLPQFPKCWVSQAHPAHFSFHP